MKAALEAWGADSNLFHQGAAKESHDPDVIAATMAKPGVALKRPVGSNGSFGEHAELPANLGSGGKPAKAARKPEGRKPKKASAGPVDRAAERKAALAYEREQTRREREQASEEAARQKERERRQQAIDKAQAALHQADREHSDRTATIRTEVEALEKRSQAEDARWKKEKERLTAALKRREARSLPPRRSTGPRAGPGRTFQNESIRRSTCRCPMKNCPVYQFRRADCCAPAAADLSERWLG